MKLPTMNALVTAPVGTAPVVGVAVVAVLSAAGAAAMLASGHAQAYYHETV